MMGAQPVKLRIELIQMGEVAQADRATAHLVLIGGTDAAPRRADLARAAGVFAQPVKIAVEGQDQRDVFGDVEIVRRDGDALGGQLLYLRLQRPGTEDRKSVVWGKRVSVRVYIGGGRIIKK